MGGWGSGAGAIDEFDDVKFDFEESLNEILPQLNAPGHHQSEEARRAAVEAAAVSAPMGMSHSKLEEKYRSVVCRHWLRGLCMKGETCEFLHQYDVDRMPVCRWGTNCKITDCPYRHVDDNDKPQCVFYQQGFCYHGLTCRYRHVKQPASKRPVIADFSLGIAQNGSAATQERTGTAGPPEKNEFYKISICKHFLGAGCPYGDDCHFAHGEHELRPFMGRRGNRPPREHNYRPRDNNNNNNNKNNGPPLNLAPPNNNYFPPGGPPNHMHHQQQHRHHHPFPPPGHFFPPPQGGFLPQGGGLPPPPGSFLPQGSPPPVLGAM